MERIISEMLSEYECGRMSRRHLIRGLSALALPASPALAAESTFKAVGLNHIAIRVADIRRSREFYQKHLGLPLIRESEASCFLKMGDEFLTLFKNERAGLDHYCVAIENFKVDAVTGTDRIYFPDPDGLEVQLSSVDHRA
jgi:hypothetical protein